MQIRYLIIEDEAVPAQRLSNLIMELRPGYECAGMTDSIEDTACFLGRETVDLIFMDVELADGNSFSVFDRVNVKTPVIFITAYSEYAIEAFRVNSIDYILKPVKKVDLEDALNKFEAFGASRQAPDYGKIVSNMTASGTKKRLLIAKGHGYSYLEVADVSFFLSEDKYTFAHTFSGKHHLVDHTLSKLISQLDPETFFRISRNYIVNIKAILEIKKYFDGRLKVIFVGDSNIEIIVSAARREDFLKWIGGE